MGVTPDTTSPASPQHPLILFRSYLHCQCSTQAISIPPLDGCHGSLQISPASFVQPHILHIAARMVSSNHKFGHVASLLNPLSDSHSAHKGLLGQPAPAQPFHLNSQFPLPSGAPARLACFQSLAHAIHTLGFAHIAPLATVCAKPCSHLTWEIPPPNLPDINLKPGLRHPLKIYLFTSPPMGPAQDKPNLRE